LYETNISAVEVTNTASWKTCVCLTVVR